MTNQYKNLINDVFGDLSAVTTEKLQAFQREILREVFTLRSLIESDSPEKRAEALERGKILKELLDGKKQAIQEKLGLTPEGMKTVADLITGYSQERAATQKKVKNKKIINLAG